MIDDTYIYISLALILYISSFRVMLHDCITLKGDTTWKVIIYINWVCID